MIIKGTVKCSVLISGVVTNAKGEEVPQSIRVSHGKQYAIVYLPTGDEYNHVTACYLVHRLVAQYWLKPSEIGLRWIRHKDGNTLNNKAFNLEWCAKNSGTRIGNGRQGTKHTQTSKNKISKALKGTKHPKYKGSYICAFAKYESAHEAARWLKLTPKTIIQRCKGDKMRKEGWYFIPK